MKKIPGLASFDVDAQKCFTPLCPFELPVPEGEQIVAALNAQAELAQFRLGSKDAHSPKALWIADDAHPNLSPIAGKHMDVRWVEHAVPGTVGFEALEGLPHPADYDFFVWKGVELDMHPYGPCYHDLAEKLSTGVIEFLGIHEIKSVVIGGLALDYCVKNAALQLQRAGFQSIINLSATRGLSAETVEEAVSTMKKAGVKFIANTQE